MQNQFQATTTELLETSLWTSYCQENCDAGLALNGGDLTVEILDKGFAV